MKKLAMILSLLAVAVNSYGQNWADSIFYSGIRPNEELKLHTLYIDTLEYIDYDDNYDDFFILVKTGDEIFAGLICNDIHQIVSDLDLTCGDIIEIEWSIDSLRPEGDKELLWFMDYAGEITKIKSGEKQPTEFDQGNTIQERRRHWKTGEFLDGMERKKIIIPLLDDELEIKEGGEFPCIVHVLRGSSSYFEIKREKNKYVIWGKKYGSIDKGVEDYLKNDFFKYSYADKKRRKQAWKSFVRDGGLQKTIDFINEIIDDEFLDSPLNEIYG